MPANAAIVRLLTAVPKFSAKRTTADGVPLGVDPPIDDTVPEILSGKTLAPSRKENVSPDQLNVLAPLTVPDGDNTLTGTYNGIAMQSGVILSTHR